MTGNGRYPGMSYRIANLSIKQADLVKGDTLPRN